MGDYFVPLFMWESINDFLLFERDLGVMSDLCENVTDLLRIVGG